MALPQRDSFIEEIKRTDALLEYAVVHGDVEESERLREKLKRLTEKMGMENKADNRQMKTNYVLIDWENVQPDNIKLLNLDWFRVLLFVGKNQRKLPVAVTKQIQQLGDRAQYIEMSGTGHNALDFHIAYYIGKLSATDQKAYFHIVSKDKGFDPLIEHLRENKVLADRVSLIEEIPALMPAKAAQPKPAPVKQAASKPAAKQPKKGTYRQIAVTMKAERCRTEKSIRNKIKSDYFKTETEIDSIIKNMKAHGLVSFDANGHATW